MENDLLLWKNISNTAQIIGGVVIFISGIFIGVSQYKINKIENEISQKQNKDSDDQKNSIDRINAMINDRADEEYPGFTFVVALKIKDNKTMEREFLLDSGKQENTDRVSLYLDSKKNLVYRIIDHEQESHIVKVPQSDFTFKENNIYVFALEYGYSDRYSFMRIFIDNKEIGRHAMKYRINLQPEQGTTLIGTNLSKKHFSNFQLLFSQILSATLNREQRTVLYNATVEYLRDVNRI